MGFITYGLMFLMGTCFGSFINMLEYRTAIGYGLVSSRSRRPWRSLQDCFFANWRIAMTNRSFCDCCGRQLSWFENIPLISWIIQKGNTRCCGKKLPLSYPIVELLTGILFLVFVNLNVSQGSGEALTFVSLTGFFTSFRMTVAFLIGLVVIVFLIFSAVFDFKYMILPDFSTGILVVCAMILLYMTTQGRPLGSPLQNIIAALAAGVFLLLLHLITKGKGMGLGDVKLAVFMGLFLGGYKTIVAFYFAFIIGAIVGVVLIILKKAGRNSLIPFGPFLIAGTLIAWWWGDFVINLIKSSL